MTERGKDERQQNASHTGHKPKKHATLFCQLLEHDTLSQKIINDLKESTGGLKRRKDPYLQ